MAAAEYHQLPFIVPHGNRALRAIGRERARREGPPIDQDVIEQVEAGVRAQRREMIGERVIVRFSLLGHQVGHVDPRRRQRGERRRDTIDEQRGNQTGVEAAGSYDDQVSIDQRLDGFGDGPRRLTEADLRNRGSSRGDGDR